MKKLYVNIIMCASLLAACGTVDDDERLAYVKPADVARKVLIEDFTGQRCVNCPNATDEIARLQEVYGDNVVAVGIHSGPLGFYTRGDVLGLSTETGEEYYNYWHVEYQPAGVVDRNGGVLGYPYWQSKVSEDIQQPATVAIDLKATADEKNIDIEVATQSTTGTTAGKLQVWVTEDEINALQLMPDGQANAGYIHQHVFRAAVNGTWGTDVRINEGETAEEHFQIALDPAWDASHLSIVAFVYNDQGVMQVEKVHVETTETSNK